MTIWWMRVAIWRAWLMGLGGVKKEPFLRDASSGKVLDNKDLRADFMAHGVWERQRVAFFDNR
eukprot:CAMPEP_0206383254 /NCGR_PEP_ID=MMETSP0294-20121207/13800_1 /ASSEMBLY_ACC=CAM_ASM_000327 /TAXON_ID=39354 /ORGANISM="Heterosigma akashiwo, Strain CCMP2393" /LENGTH=62 /DNA_ID=CAMNT_0053833199 /DNA_START=14 /DNA_END=198 /DNA_ORIENTATION=+